LLYPRLYVSSLFEIDFDHLRSKGIRGLIFDLDNTLVRRDCDCVSDHVVRWLGALQESGFGLCVVSNNGRERVRRLTAPLAIPAVHRAVKPRSYPFLRGMEILGTTPGQTAVIGDQIFTDVLGGNLLGLYTILVVPMEGKEFIGTRLIGRPLEKLVLAGLKKTVER
jgi:HAD superfamily phosphatase (TIGR01668 family)